MLTHRLLGAAPFYEFTKSMKSGPSSDEVPDLLGALLKNRGEMSRRVLGGKSGDFPGAEEGLLGALVLCPSSGSTVVVFFIYKFPQS